MRALLTAFLLAFVVTDAPTQHFATVGAQSALSPPDPRPSAAALISRAKAIELDTAYVAPPRRPTGAPRGRLRQSHVFGRIHHRA